MQKDSAQAKISSKVVGGGLLFRLAMYISPFPPLSIHGALLSADSGTYSSSHALDQLWPARLCGVGPGDIKQQTSQRVICWLCLIGAI